MALSHGSLTPMKGNSEWSCGFYTSKQGIKLNVDQGSFRSSWWLGKSWHYSSKACRLVILPEGHLPIITTRGQEPWLLGIPSHTVDILGVSLAHMSCQREGRLLWIWAGILLKHSDGIVPTSCSQGPCQLTPGRNTHISGKGDDSCLSNLVNRETESCSTVSGLVSSQTSGISLASHKKKSFPKPLH